MGRTFKCVPVDRVGVQSHPYCRCPKVVMLDNSSQMTQSQALSGSHTPMAGRTRSDPPALMRRRLWWSTNTIM
jgi:hypothetical protein